MSAWICVYILSLCIILRTYRWIYKRRRVHLFTLSFFILNIAAECVSINSMHASSYALLPYFQGQNPTVPMREQLSIMGNKV